MTASLVFVDFQKAFDTLHRSSIPVIFSQYNVPNCLISDIIQMYSDTSACVSTELGPTEWFETTSGVLKGDTLSPYLFIVLLDYALKKTLQDNVGFVVRKRNGSRHPAIHIGVLAYADDICLLAESIDDVECWFKWKLPLRGRITYRHCRQPKLPTFLYSSNADQP